MSYYNDECVWVGDLDSYINIDAISREAMWEKEREALEIELDSLGEYLLLSGQSISARTLNYNGVTQDDWRHAQHQAEMALGANSREIWVQNSEIRANTEKRFLSELLSLGRPYAISRYAKLEKLEYPAAVTATFPYGIRALIDQFLVAEGLQRSSTTDQYLRSALKSEGTQGVTAYRRCAKLQSALYAIADAAHNHSGGRFLDKNRTRQILSLTRLHFSVTELHVTSRSEIMYLWTAYDTDRFAMGTALNHLDPDGTQITNWRLRHIRPLLDLYPISIRHSLARTVSSDEDTPEAIVNELALIHCELSLMRKAAISRNSDRRKARMNKG